MKTALFEYQHLSISKLLNLKVGALFCEMGTGKTRMAIEWLLSKNDKIDHVLWFCPVSLKEQTKEEIRKHTDVGVTVVGLQTISSSDREYLRVRQSITDKTAIIVDESSFIKNIYAKRTARLLDMSKLVEYKLILSGTPITKNLGDLYTQITFLSEKILGYKAFKEFEHNHIQYDLYTGKVKAYHNARYFFDKMEPYVVFLKQKDVLPLPEQCYEKVNISLTEDERTSYDTVKQEFANIDISAWNSTVIFALFTKLQIIVANAEHKVTELEKFKDKKCIVWTKFKEEQDRISHLGFCINGATPHKLRAELLNKWRETGGMLIASINIMSYGFNLQDCAIEIFYSNTFDWAVRYQAEKRIHRVGQMNKCLYIDFTTDMKIDGIISKSLKKKQNTIDAFGRIIKEIQDAKLGTKEVLALL